MMTAVVQRTSDRPQVPPSVLLIGKKRTMDYVAPGLSRINNTGELVIRATGSLSIVTAVDVAEIVKRDADVLTKSITIGTDELRVATGETKRMSCIEICLIRNNPMVAVAPAVDVHVPVEETAPSTIEIPIEEVTPADTVVEVPVTVAKGKARKPRAKRKSPAAAKKRLIRKKKKSASF